MDEGNQCILITPGMLQLIRMLSNGFVLFTVCYLCWVAGTSRSKFKKVLSKLQIQQENEKQKETAAKWKNLQFEKINPQWPAHISTVAVH